MNCAAHTTKPVAVSVKATRCEQLGVCQGLGPDQCPDCNSWECEVPCSPEPPRPTYPFAPGVIEGAPKRGCIDADSECFPLSLRETIEVCAVVAVLAAAAGYLVDRFA